jgi:hypothetical protein
METTLEFSGGNAVKHIVNVSGGMASAVALFRVIERFGGGAG